MDVHALLPSHVNVAELVHQYAAKDEDYQAACKKEDRGAGGEAKTAPVNEHPEEHQHEGWMEPYLYTIEARDCERFAHVPRLPIFGMELKTSWYEKWLRFAIMLDSGVGMTRPPLERPARHQVRFLQHD